MTSYSVKRNIQAEPEKIWGLLTDSATYGDWNPTVINIEGTIAQGQKIKLTSIVNPKREFSLTVEEFQAPHRMVWSDGMPLGLFKGVRTYLLTPQDDGSTEFFMEEVYTGFLAPLITRSIPDMTDSFEQIADGLKQASESG